MNRQEVMLGLLQELDSICREKNLTYSVVGPCAEALNEGVSKMGFDYIYVAMTAGEIDTFIKEINSGRYADRKVEYLLNNKNAVNNVVRFCNSKTTLINADTYGRYENYGIYIRIIEIRKSDVDSKERKKIRLMERILKSANGNGSADKSVNRSAIYAKKIIFKVIGRDRLCQKLFDSRRVLYGIEKWDDISKHQEVRCKNVKILNADVPKEAWKVRDIEVDGHKYMFADILSGVCFDNEKQHKTAMEREIVNVNLPYDKIAELDVLENLKIVAEAKARYKRNIRKHFKAKDEVDRAWNLYLMSRDVVFIRDYYDQDRMAVLQNAINNKDKKRFLKEINDYLEKKSYWLNQKLPFEDNPLLEECIRKAEIELGITIEV